MDLIQNNPYRTVGLLVGATAREQERQVKRLKQFIEAEQDPQDDFSFPTLGNLHRTLDKVNEAASKLNLDSDKMSSALFWFYKGNPITDEPAFDAIKEADLDQVINIWTKLTSNGEVSQRNASAYSNLGTLYLSGILEGTNTNEAILEQGISLKLKFLESEFSKEFKELATDGTYKATKKELQLLFLNQIQSEVEKSGTVTSNKFLDILTKQEFSAKEDFLKGFVQKPIEQIERQIDESKAKRKTNKANAITFGEELQNQTLENLNQLKSILGASNIKYASIADKVANEILQCTIDYFNYHQETENDNDYFEPALKLAKSTEKIAIGKVVRDRIEDTLNTFEEMKDRELSAAIQVLKSIKAAYEEACNQIDRQVDELQFDYLPSFDGTFTRFPKLNVSINWSKVEEMKRKALDWDKVVELIQRAIPMQNVNKIENTNNSAKLNEYKSLVDFLISKLGYFQLSKVKYISYWKDVSPMMTTAKNITSQKTKDACYIATMTYGDYDHPQVIILRRFRDEVLDKSAFGKWFIKTYYHYSPRLVERLKNQRTVNSIIRKALNQFIKLIK
jgi:hypothetical protein